MVTVNDQFVFSRINFDSSIELSVHCIILKHVSHVINRQKVIDTYYNNIVLVSLFKSRTENETADTTKSINTYFNHFINLFLRVKNILFVLPSFAYPQLQ